MLPVPGKSETDRQPTGRKNRRPAATRLVPRKQRVSVEEERLEKSRRTIDAYFRKIGKHFGRELSLNKDGVAYLPFRKFILVVEVPPDNADYVILYTAVCLIKHQRDVSPVLQKAMQLNYMQLLTRGATLGWDGDEVNMCFSPQIAGMGWMDLQKIIEDFQQTAMDMHAHLEAGKRSCIINKLF